MTNNEKAINELAPCGLDCSRCVSYKKGEVTRLSAKLLKALTNFEKVADRSKRFNPIFNSYPEFVAILEYFTKGNCLGCRFTDAPAPGCSIRACHKEHQVDFCAECSHFPCTPTTYTPDFTQTWLENNQAIQKQGLASFYESQKAKPRY